MAWSPSVEEVAALLRARTKTDAGEEIGTFDEDTRPTGEQVEIFIANATGVFISCTGDWLPDSLHPLARYVLSLHAAIHIELSLFPEQLDSDHSAYDELKALYDETWPKLCELATPHRPDEIPTPEAAGGDVPLFQFGPLPLIEGIPGVFDPETETIYYREGRILGWYST